MDPQSSGAEQGTQEWPPKCAQLASDTGAKAIPRGTSDLSNAGATGRRRARKKMNLKSRPFTETNTKQTTDFSVERKLTQHLEKVQEKIFRI